MVEEVQDLDFTLQVALENTSIDLYRHQLSTGFLPPKVDFTRLAALIKQVKHFVFAIEGFAHRVI